MNFRQALLALLLAWPAGGALTEPASRFAQAEEALAARLWEVAAERLLTILEEPGLDPASQGRAEVLLAEAWIRGGDPQKALELLSKPPLVSQPEAYFWKGQALAGLGRFSEAVDTFQAAYESPPPPHRKLAVFTCANLQLALGQPEAALASLARLAEAAGPATQAESRLRQIEILLDLGRPEEARSLMPTPASIPESARPAAQFLEATLALAEGEPQTAEAAFSAILAAPRGHSLLHFHAAALGRADALHAGGNSRAASESLLDFIEKQRDSPLLEECFERLLAWLPEVPAASDPLIGQLSAWIPTQAASAPGPIVEETATAVSTWPRPIQTSELAAFSLFARGVALHRLGTPAAKQEARVLLTRLTLEYPDHFLAQRALLEISRWLLNDGNPERATAVLAVVRDREGTRSPVRGVAAHVAGRAAYTAGETLQAAELFDEAAALLPVEDQARARFNAALARLASGEIITIQAEPGAPFPAELSVTLKLEQALAATPPEEAAAALATFLAEHPDHPRAAEARLAAAEAALAANPPDPAMARSQLDALETATEVPASSLPQIGLARLRLLDLANDPSATIPAAHAFLDRFQDDPAATEAAWVLARNHLATGNFNDARIELEKLAAAEADADRAQAAWLLAAHSATLVPTVRSKEEALGLFDRAIASGGPLAPFAQLKKARLMVDLGHLSAAVEFLRPWLASLPDGDPLQIAGGILLAESLAAGEVPAREEALAIHERLLDSENLSPALRHQLQYVRGRLLEELPKPGHPGQTREAEALEAYYSVLESATRPPAEWVYFELAGTRALALLEKAKRWKAAITIAEKIASFGGPQADEAAKRAQDIRLKHMIWEE